MSYKNKVLKDNPIGFWPLDELYTSVYTISSYNDSEFYDLPVYYNSFSAFSQSAQDISGCGNDGSYSGDFPLNDYLIPLIPGGQYATNISNSGSITLPVTKDYYGNIASGGIGDSDSSDNDFSLEIWIYPKFTTSNLTPIFGDLVNGVGLFWENGNIVFKLNNERIDYTVPYTKQSLHIVATYSPAQMTLYVNGKMVSIKSLSKFKFTNSTFEPTIGPTLNASDSFLVDGPAAYRYDIGLSKVVSHYNEIQPLPPIQIAHPDKGEIFDFYDNILSTEWSYSYPANKSWEYFITTDLYYNKTDKSLEIVKSTGAKTVVLEDIITVPVSLFLDSSKIEWEGENGISVETSLDGVTYSSATNGGTIPGYTIDSFGSNRIVYLRITMTTSDSSKYLPKLSSLLITFYNNHRIYALNSGSYFSTLEGVSGVTKFDATVSNQSYPILSRHARNGIKTITNSGFYIKTQSAVKTLEFFYTPDSLSQSGLINILATNGYSAANVSWNGSGVLSKSNISGLYVNGVNRSSETNVSGLFVAKELHHVVIIFTSAVSGNIKFNHATGGSIPALFQNIALYPDQFTSGNVLTHYNIYINRPALVADDSSFAMTESSVSMYDNDWVVIKTV